MKSTAIIFLFLFSTLIACSQRSANTWFFGNKVGLNFNVDPPQPDYRNPKKMVEGSSVISDANGDLLFFTNGLEVYDKMLNVMPGSEGLLGDLSSTSNSIIIPFPTSDSLYYIITIGAAGRPDQGLRYNIIDMSRRSGSGEIISDNNLMETQSFEKLAAVRHCNGKDVWLTVKVFNSDQYHTYLISSAGITLSHVFSSGFNPGIVNYNYVGQMKFSADGSKLATAFASDLNKIELISFDRSTGVLSGAIRFSIEATAMVSEIIGAYGVSFSPDGRLLYASASFPGRECVLYQFDVSSMNVASINASRYLVHSANGALAGGLQEAPDGKVYFSIATLKELSVISNPNVTGSGCNFVRTAINLSRFTDNMMQYGLPSFISSDVNPAFAPHDFNFSRACNTFDASFFLTRISDVDSVRWFFHDGSQSVALAPSKTYSGFGSYPVKARIYYSNCASGSVEVEHNVVFAETSNKFLPADSTACTFNSFTIAAVNTSGSYQWSDGSTGSSFVVTSPGDFWVDVTENGCTVRDSFSFSLQQAPVVDAGRDTSVCTQTPIRLLVSTNTGNAVEWNTGSVNSSIVVDKAGEYIVTETNVAGCSSKDTVVVKWGDCPFLLPNAFTPGNNDEKNKYFYLLNGLDAKNFEMRVFNRYGQVVYHSNDLFGKWDGSFQGKPQPAGVYIWQITYVAKKQPVLYKGTVLLIR